jgi:deoxyribodipyrimidine photolyase-related protein
MSQGRLRLVLGDQLTRDLSSLSDLDPARDRVLLAEVISEASYVPHHKKKIAFLFSAMRHFAQELREEGVSVDYIPLDDPENSQSLKGEAARALKRHDLASLVVTEPGEWRLSSEMATWERALGRPVEIREDSRFLCSHAYFTAWAKGRKTLRMEFFYREMRRKSGLLMLRDGQPEGGRWNFDAENRKALPDSLSPPRRRRVEPDAITREVLALVEDRFADNFGTLEGFAFAVTASQAEEALEAFLEDCLPRFGDYQDAMKADEPFLYHSLLSAYINAGLLDPLAACRRAEARYQEGKAPLNAVEGFIRQIIGWREFIRGVYWLKMPGYAEENALGAGRDLPWFYWSGETGLHCLSQAVRQTREEAYAHHIQRLMVLGNFALLAGIDPKQVNDWFLIVYADAYEWVELPNVSGMAIYADGGVFASKPYAASGKYIKRMSDYCKDCRYDPEQSEGEGACPFNALYWDFIARNRELFGKNPRMAMPLRTWERMKPAKQRALRDRAESLLSDLEAL